MTSEPTRRTALIPRSLSFPIRRSLEGVSWASLSVEWRPTEDQKRQIRDEIEPLWLLNQWPDKRPSLHPLGCRRFPFERFYSRLGRTAKPPQPAERVTPRSRSEVQSPSAS